MKYIAFNMEEWLMGLYVDLYDLFFYRLDLDACKSRLRKARSVDGQSTVSNTLIRSYCYVP